MSRQGFTLIELLLVLAIVGIMLVMAGNAYVRSVRSAELRETANQVVADFRRARTQAQRGSTDISLVIPKAAKSKTYTVGGRNVTLTNNVTIQPICAGVTVCANDAMVTYTAPFGEIDATGNVFRLTSPMSSIAPLEIRVVGITGKVMIVRSSI